MTPRQFEPRRMLITGVSRGLGQAMAVEFARLGHVAVGCSRSRKSVEALQARLGAPHRFDIVDVADDAAVKAWATAGPMAHPTCCSTTPP